MSTKRRPAAPKRPTVFMKTIAEIYVDAGKGFRFRIKATNGEIISQGEAYSRKSSAVRGAKRAFPRATIKDLSL